MTAKKGPPVPAATLRLNTPSKRLFSVIGMSGLLLFIFGLLLLILNRGRSTDLQYTLAGLGEWCMLVGPLACIVGLFGSVFYDFTIRPIRLSFERLPTWIVAGS